MKNPEVLDYIRKKGWFNYVNAKMIAEWGHFEVLLYMYYSGRVFDSDLSIISLPDTHNGNFIDYKSCNYDRYLADHFFYPGKKRNKLCNVKWCALKTYFYGANLTAKQEYGRVFIIIVRR